MLEPVCPFTFVFVTITPDIHSLAISPTVLPFTNIVFIIDTSPDPKSILQTFLPLTVVCLTGLPFEDTSSMGFTISEVSFI
jgi:hypothetical protein